MEILYPRVLNYKKEKFHEVKDIYEGLANGQSPGSLLITCSDSRLSPQMFTDTQPGEVFVVRNAGNLVAEYDPNSVTNEALTIEYGVVALGVKEIVVCGHVSCGAMAGLLNVESLGQMPLVQKSLSAYKEKYIDEIRDIHDVDGLIKWNVDRQLQNLYSYPFIKERVDAGQLTLWGWVFDFVNHEIKYKQSLKQLQKEKKSKVG